uniref:hypothetical protein n=1 Tax=Flavobacterium sp. TaxID=239 RepID=UPI00404A02BD
MLSEDLILSILFGLASILYYRIHKWWLSGRDKNPIFLKLETNTKSVENWVILFFLAITSIGFLIKSII